MAASGAEPVGRRVARPLLMAALAVGFLGRALFTGDVLLPAGYLHHFAPWQSAAPPPPEHWNALIWDAMAQYYPWRAYAHDALARGIIPLWNPFQFCGTPFVANSQSAVFYPPNLLFYLLPPARAFAIAAALHLWLAGLFTYLFLRALGRGRFGAALGGVAFAFSGFLAAWLQLPTVLDTAVWLPLALFCVARFFATRRPGYVVGLGLVTGTALLAGHPQMFLYVAGVTALYFAACAVTGAGAGRASPGRLGAALLAAAAAAALALLWGAVQLLPSAELLSFSHRATAASAQGYSAYLRFAMPWQQLITLVLPEFMGNPAYGTYWGRGNFAEYAAYVGALPLALAALALIWRRDRHTVFFAAVALLALLAALGTPISRLLFYAIPGFSSTGGPGRMLFIYSTAIAILAGSGADAAARALAEADRGRRFARHLAVAAIVMVVAAGALVLGIAASLHVPAPALLSAPAVNLLVALLSLCAGVGALWVASRRQSGSAAALGVLLAASVFELFAFGMGYYRTAPPGSVYPPTELTAYLGDRDGAGRIMPLHQSWGLDDFPRAVLPPNAAMVYGLRDVQGYDSLYLARYRQVLARVEGRDPSPRANGNMLLGAPCDPALLAVLGVRYVLSETPLDVPGLTRERAGEVNLYRVQNSVPRAYMARSAVVASGLLGSLSQLGEAAGGGVVLETGEPLPRVAPLDSARDGPEPVEVPPTKEGMVAAMILRDGINRVRLDAPRAGYLVLSDAYYPGWRAWVEGKPAEICLANGAFRAVRVGPGEHEVEMRFAPTSFRLGLFASMIAAAVGMAGVGASLGGRRRRVLRAKSKRRV